MRELLSQAVALLTETWGTTTLVPLDMCACMALVQLPDGIGQDTPATSADAKYIQDLLHHHHSIECPVKCIQGVLYVRISAMMYNTIDDYRKLADSVSSMRGSQKHTL